MLSLALAPLLVGEAWGVRCDLGSLTAAGIETPLRLRESLPWGPTRREGSVAQPNQVN